MGSEAIYHRVEASQIIPDRDLVIEIVPGEAGPLAAITDPKSTSTSEPMPIPQALKVVENELALEPGYFELVIIDENDLWRDEWGTLDKHPSRISSKETLSL